MPFQTAKRPVSGCKTARLGSRNGAFCNQKRQALIFDTHREAGAGAFCLFHKPVFGDFVNAELYPKSAIRVRNDFILLSRRLAVVFVEGVAGYVETKRQARCRQENESVWKAEHSYNNKYLAV